MTPLKISNRINLLKTSPQQRFVGNLVVIRSLNLVCDPGQRTLKVVFGRGIDHLLPDFRSFGYPPKSAKVNKLPSNDMTGWENTRKRRFYFSCLRLLWCIPNHKPRSETDSQGVPSALRQSPPFAKTPRETCDIGKRGDRTFKNAS